MVRVILLLVLASLAAGQDRDEPSEWKILPHEPFRVGPLAANERAKALIDKLVELDKPRDGVQDRTGGGTGFEPTNDPFGRLVRLGPAALPALFRHLEDKRKTKLVFTPHAQGVGGIFRCHDLLVPPGRAAERARIREAFGKGVNTGDAQGASVDVERPSLESYTVTVGDCCFAILGQIVNRPYEAVRYQPSLITAVCSPTLDARVARAVRVAWRRGDPRQMLAKSLQDDFFTRGPGSSWFQADAAARLCLYFPAQGGKLVARRLAGLTFDAEKDGVDAHPLLWYATRADHPAVRAAWLKFLDPAKPEEVLAAVVSALPVRPDAEVTRRLLAIVDVAKDSGLLLGCMERLQPAEAKRHFKRLEEALDRAEAKGQNGRQECRTLIEAMMRADKQQAVAPCRRHMRAGHPQKLTVLAALFRIRDEDLAIAIAAPRLDDGALLGGWGRAPLPEEYRNGDRRVCDFAAAVLARSVEGLVFRDDERIEQRDREIAAMRRALAKR
jgi:hypothetical protein